MKSKLTIVLVVLAGVAGVWLWKGDEWAPRLGIRPAHPEPPKSETIAVLDGIAPSAITRIEVAFPGGAPLVLERAAPGSTWKLPGNWPPRLPEVDELVQTLGSLHSRFHAIPVPEDADLARYGLSPNQKPLVVQLTVGSKPVTLTIGQPRPGAGESPFTSPAYVRVDQAREVVKLGPDVMPVVSRAAEQYRRRALFPEVERVKLAGGAAPPADPFSPPAGDTPVTVTIPGDGTASIRVSRNVPSIWNLDLSPAFGFTLVRTGRLPEPAVLSRGGESVVPLDRLADAWAMDAPTRDRVDPARLRGVLAAVADLWVEEFVSPVPAESKLGLAGSDRAVTVTRTGAEPVTIRIGGIARISEREEMITVPGGPPGAPPQKLPRKVTTEYRYARIDGNPQVFVVNADRLKDLFVATADLVDPQVARFARDEVRAIRIRPEGRPELRLFLKKGDAKAARAEEKQDRWFIDAKPNPILADTGRVDELLEQLGGFRTAGADRTQFPAAAPAPQTRITIVTRDPRPEGEPEGPARELTLLVGKPDAIHRQVPVQLDGWPRVTLARNTTGPDDPEAWISALLFPNTITDLIERPAIAYRSRKLFDAAAELTGVSVAGGFVLDRAGADWKLTAPVVSEADPGAAGKLASALAGLSATDYLADAPATADLATYGLAKPAHAVTLRFQGGRSYALELGAPRPGKPEVFARLDKGAVFGLPNTIVEQLTTGVVGLLPLKVWSALPEKITAVQVTRPGAPAESFALTKEGTNWKLTGPFAAPVSFLGAQPLLTGLGNLTALKYQALTAPNPAEFGLDKPLLTLRVAFLETPPGAAAEVPVAKSVAIGAATPDGTGRFARLDTPGAPIFIVPTAFVAAAQTPPLELLDRSLLLLDPARIAKIKVADGKSGEAFSLARAAGGKWTAEGATFAVDEERIAQLTGAAARLPVTRLAGYGDAVVWAEFGLDKPEVLLTLSLDGEKSELHTIALGKSDPLGGRYARVDDGKALAVIPASAAVALARKRFDYADRTLLRFNPITLVAFVRKQGKDELELAPAAGIGWDIIQPAKQKADQPLMDELADALGKLRAERVAAYGKKDEVYKKYGLEPPAASFTLTVGDNAEHRTLRLGSLVDAAKPDGERYAAVDSPNPEIIVGVLSAALAKKLLAPAVAFRDHTLARFVDADRAVLERGDRKITFAKVGVTWKVTEPLPAAAEAAELEALIADLGKLRVDTWLGAKGKDLKPFGLDRPEAKWTLSYGDRPVLVLLIGQKTADGRVPVATESGELVGLLDSAMTARVLAEYRQRKPWDLDAAQIQSIEVAAAGGKFTLEKSGMMWLDSAKPAESIDARVVNELLGTLGALRVERYAADTKADLKLFGLEKPDVTLTVQSGMARHILQIGGTVGGTGGQQRYARIVDGGRTDVFVLSAADTARLTRGRAEYLMKK